MVCALLEIAKLFGRRGWGNVTKKLENSISLRSVTFVTNCRIVLENGGQLFSSAINISIVVPNELFKYNQSESIAVCYLISPREHDSTMKQARLSQITYIRTFTI